MQHFTLGRLQIRTPGHQILGSQEQASSNRYIVIEPISLWHLDSMNAKVNAAWNERQRSYYHDAKLQRTTAYGTLVVILVLLATKLKSHCQQPVDSSALYLLPFLPRLLVE